MGLVRPPQPVKLLVSMLAADVALFDVLQLKSGCHILIISGSVLKFA